MDMNWDDVRVFLAVARAGNLRRAGQRLGLSQPTAGRRLQALESALGVALFSRGRRGHRLTAAGEALLPRAEAMQHAAAELARAGGGLGQAPGGVVRISANEWPALFLARALPPSADDFAIELVVSEQTEQLTRREADLAVRHGLPATGEFLTRRAGRIATAIYGAADYVAAHPEASTRRRFAACDWVAYTEEQAHFQSMLWLGPRLGARRPAVRASSTALLRDAVRTGAGLGLLPCFLGDATPELERVGGPIAGIAADYWLIVPRELAPLPRLRRAIDWVVGSFAAERARLAGDV